MSKPENIVKKVKVESRKKQGQAVDYREILEEELRKRYKERSGKARTGIKLPEGLLFYKEEDKIIIKLSKEAVQANMQKDAGAFDSWALALKSWLTGINKIVIEWEKPENTSNEVYQRFLYRVKKVREIFTWIKIEKSCEVLLEDSKIKSGNIYYVNVPGPKSIEKASKQEAIYERLFINTYNEELAKAANMNNSRLYNQLPLGLFKNTKCKDNRVFKGSLDIWGIDKEKEELNIFELKKPNYNLMVGIVSELLFYTLFLKDILQRNFIYEDISKIKNYSGIHELINGNYKKIKGYFLATKLHPLIDKNLIDLINSHLEPCNIELSHIKFFVCEDGTVKC